MGADISHAGIAPGVREEFSKIYSLGPTVGKGAFAVVKRAMRKEDGKQFAVKIIKKSDMEQDALARVHNEVEVMLKIDHPACVKMHQMFENEKHLVLVMEYIDGGDLFSYLENTNVFFSEDDAGMVCYRVAGALKYLHSKGIAHRDLKPENLLCVRKGDRTDVKLSDFGEAKCLRPGETMLSPHGSPSYVAPEILMHKDYGVECDIWSLGVILFALLSGTVPFNGEGNRTKLFSLIKEGKYDFSAEIWKSISLDAQDLIKRCLTLDPKQRIKAEEIMQHSFCRRAWLKKQQIRRWSTIQSDTSIFGGAETVDKTSPKTRPKAPSTSNSSSSRRIFKSRRRAGSWGSCLPNVKPRRAVRSQSMTAFPTGGDDKNIVVNFLGALPTSTTTHEETARKPLPQPQPQTKVAMEYSVTINNEEDAATGATVLVLQGPDCRGLIAASTSALSLMNINLLSANVTTKKGWAKNTYRLKKFNRMLSKDDFEALAEAVLKAVHRLARRQAQLNATRDGKNTPQDASGRGRNNNTASSPPSTTSTPPSRTTPLTFFSSPIPFPLGPTPNKVTDNSTQGESGPGRPRTSPSTRLHFLYDMFTNASPATTTKEGKMTLPRTPSYPPIVKDLNAPRINPVPRRSQSSDLGSSAALGLVH
eukprot:g69499.t1